MHRRTFATCLSALALAPIFGALGCDREPARPDIPPLPPSAPSNVTLPPDGAPLFSFLLKEIPELVDKVPCSCCDKNLGACFRGACPPTCGPCNKIGRAVYLWHLAGSSDDEIVALVKAKFPRT